MILSPFEKIISAVINSRQIKKIRALKHLRDKIGFVQDIYYNYKKIAFAVTIDHITACNRKCPYCPHFWSGRDTGLMPDGVYYKIIDDLHDLDFQGQIIFAPWSEPLLDDRLEDFAGYAKDNLPKCTLIVLTNGDLLTIKKFQALISSGIDMIDVSDHYSIEQDRYMIGKPRQAIETYLQLDEVNRKKIHFHDPNYKRIRGLERFHNRSGLVPLKNCVTTKKLCRICIFPETILAINYKGDVLLCARQWRESPVYGNIIKEHIKDIWQNPEFIRVRKALRKGIFELDLCQSCGWGYALAPEEITTIIAARDRRERSGGKEISSPVPLTEFRESRI